MGTDIAETVLPISDRRADERYGPKPGRWRQNIPQNTYIIPPQPYHDPRRELPLEDPRSLWPELPPAPEPKHDMREGYDGITVIKDEVPHYRWNREE